MAKPHLQQALSRKLCAGSKKTVRSFTLPKTVRSFTLPNTRSGLETHFPANYKSGMTTSNVKDAIVVKGQVNFSKITVKTNCFLAAFTKIVKSDS
jgi:hypothetical protein